jgi:hypothetical protein
MHELDTRVRHAWRSGVSDKCDGRAFVKASDQLRYAATDVVLMKAERWSRNAVMSEQPSRAAGVLRSDQIDRSKHPKSPERDVLQVADGCGDHEQRAGHRDGRKVIVPLAG